MKQKTIVSGAPIVGGWENRRRIKINNFRSIKMDDFIDIKKITLLFGKNGAGKSSFIKAIKFLGQNLFPVKADQTIYNLDHNIDLGDFEQIVIRNNLKKKIEIDFEEFWESHSQLESKIESKIINYKVSTTIQENKNGKNFKSIIIEDLKSNLKFNIYPAEKNNYKDEEIRKVINNQIFNSLDTEKDDEFLIGESKVGYSGYPNNAIGVQRAFAATNPKFKKFINYLDVLPFVSNPDELRFSYYNHLLDYIGFDYEKKRAMNSLILQFVRDIPTLTKKFFNHWYVTPVRERPLSKYRLTGDKFDSKDYYGILHQLDLVNQKYNEYYPGNEGLPNSKDFLNKSLVDLGIGKEFIIRKSGGFGSAFIKDTNGIEHNLAESSSGLIQIIPIIVASFNALYEYADYITLFAKDDSTDVIIVEQPELHLHPSLQTKLIDFITNGMGTYIIETHSEHIVRKLQVLIAKGKINKSKVAVYYFDKDEKSGITSIKEMELEDNGFFKEPWPDGFFDDSYNLAKELIYARKN